MTRGSMREYAEAVRGRYFLASKKEKGKILDEFTVTLLYVSPIYLNQPSLDDIIS